MTRVTASKTVKKSKKAMKRKLKNTKLKARQKEKMVSSKAVPESIEDQDLASSSDSKNIYISRKKMNSKDELHADVTNNQKTTIMTRVTAYKTVEKSEKSMKRKLKNKKFKARQKEKMMSSKVVPESIEDQDLASSSGSKNIYISGKKMNSKDELHADVTEYSSDASEEDIKTKNLSNAADKSSGSESEEIFNSEKKGHNPKKAKVLKKKTKAKKSKDELKKQHEDKVNTKLTEESSRKLASTSGLKEFNHGEAEDSPDASEKSEDDTESQQPKRKKQKKLKSKEPANVKKIEKSDSAENEDLLTQPLTSKSPKKTKNIDKNKKQNSVPSNEDPRFKNTIFVGNLPVDTTKKALTQLFQEFRPISSRIRGVVASKQQIPKKVAAITGKYHPGLQNVYGYVAFETEDEAKKALSLNGTEFKDHHIRVNLAIPNDVRKEVNTVYVGNLPFDIGDEAVYSHFSKFGPIDQIRVIRDKETGVGKGFGFVQFKSETSKEKAIRSETTEINERKVRIKPLTSKSFQAKDKRFTPARKPRKFDPKKKDGLLSEKKSIKKKIKDQKMQRTKKKIAAGLKAVMKD